MKETKTKYLARVSSVAMGVGLLASSGLATTTSVFASIAPNGVYGTDYFDADYSRGILYRLNEHKMNENGSDPDVTMTFSPTAPSSCHTENGTGGFTYYYCNNSSLNENIYFTVKNAAIYMNKYIDVREYVWADGGGEWGVHIGQKGGVAISSGDVAPSLIHRQLRFYQAGTNTEISFKGVMSFTDIDEGEGFEFNDGKGFHRAFIPTDGNVSTETTSGSDGTWYNFVGTAPSEPGTPPQLYVEVSGSSQSRFEFSQDLANHDGGSHDTAFSKVSYKIKNGSAFDTDSTDIVVTYGTLSPLASPTTTPEGYEFDGWYTSEGMTTKASAPLKVAADTSLYGDFDEQNPGGGEEGGGGEGEGGEEGGEEGGNKGDTPSTPDTGSNTSNQDGLNGGKAMIAPILLISLAALLGTGFAIKAKSKKKVMKFGR